jgi:tRNA(Ile)-lysidine synthase
LDVTREALVGFVEENGVLFREDSTNAKLHADRNRVRHLILPVLKKEAGEDFERVMLGHIGMVRRESEMARDAANAWLEAPKNFADLPEWLRREIVATQLNREKIAVTVELLEKLAKANRRVSISERQSVSISANGRLQVFGELWPTESALVKIEKGSAEFAGVNIAWKEVDEPDLKADARRLTFDAELLGKKIVLRHWQEGDRVRLSGRASERPLHEMFSRNKIPRNQRHRAVVGVTADGNIFWVEGLRVMENFKVTAQTKRFLEWCWKRA